MLGIGADGGRTPRFPWLLGLDAGTDSLGWAVFRLSDDGERRPVTLLDGGVRIFDGGRDRQSNESLNKARGVFRRGRRRLRARRWRRDRLIDCLRSLGLPPPNQTPIAIWALRSRAASEPLGATDFAAVLLHAARHRGFRSNRLAEQRGDAEAAEEAGKWEAAEKSLRDRMTAAGVATVGQLLARELPVPWGTAPPDTTPTGFVRARRGEGEVPTRNLVAEELTKIREAQSRYHEIDAAGWDRIEDLILEQRPLGEPKVARCWVHPEEERLAKAMPSAQRFLIRQALCNLRIRIDDLGEPRPLTPEEFGTLGLELDSGAERTWAQLRRLIGLPKGAKFTIEIDRQGGKKAARDAPVDETARLLAPLIPGWAELDLPARDRAVRDLMRLRRDRRKLLAHTRTLVSDGGAAPMLADAIQFGLPTGRLSFGPRAVESCLRHLKAGTRTHDAIAMATGRHHSDLRPTRLLDELPYYGEVLVGHIPPEAWPTKDQDARRWGMVNNVTVHVALNEIRKVTNALIRRYGGNPSVVAIETTRELKAGAAEHARIRARQAKDEKQNDQDEKDIAEAVQGETARAAGSRRERLLRWRLARRQQNVCPYTGTCMGKTDIFGAAYEIDHVIPLSMGGVDSFANMVLCEREANRMKRHKTPWQAFEGHPKYDWKLIERYVRATLPEEMHWRFATDAHRRVEDDGEGWAPRQIVDTSFIARLAASYLSHIAPDVVATRGRITGYLRKAWDLPLDPSRRTKAEAGRPKTKSRFDHRHHFVDACAIALTSRSIVKQFSDRNARKWDGDADPPDVPPPFDDLTQQVQGLYDRIWPSLRPDHSLEKPSGELHDQSLLAMVPQPSGRFRLAKRRDVDELFKPQGKLVSDAAAEMAIERFRSERFRQRFREALEERRAADPVSSLAALALAVAADRRWGPRGIGKISCWHSDGERASDELAIVMRGRGAPGTHRAAVEAKAKAWVDVIDAGRRLAGRPASKLSAALGDRSGSENALARLRKGDLVAWRDGDHLEVAFLKVIKDSGELFFWPLRLATTMEAAATRPELGIKKRDGLSFSAETLRAKGCVPATVNVLGRVRLGAWEGKSRGDN